MPPDGSGAQFERLFSGATRSALELLGDIRNAVDAEQPYALSQDLTALLPLPPHGALEAIDDSAVIDELLEGRTVALERSRLVPLMAEDFPIAVAVQSDTVATPDALTTRAAGQAFGLHLAQFDVLHDARRSRTMSEAAQLQWDQLPLRAATLDSYSVGATLEPAYTVAGDLYDFALNPRGSLTVYALDAMGHGVSATLAAALALAAARTSRRSGASLPEQVTAADDAVRREYDGDRFVTMVALEFSDSHIAVVNAGHEPMHRGSPESGFETLELAADPPLGLEGAKNHKVRWLDPLRSDEAICLISDGVVEARDRAGGDFGGAAVSHALSAGWTMSPLLMAHRLTRAVIVHLDGEVQDDITCVVVKRADRGVDV